MSAAVEISRGRGLKILLADDDPRWQELLKRQVAGALKEMRQQGDIHVASTLAETLHALEGEKHWQLVVTDVGFTEAPNQKAGMEVVMRVRGEVSCIVVSGLSLSRAEVAQVLTEYKAHRFFDKSEINLLAFIEAVKDLLGRVVHSPGGLAPPTPEPPIMLPPGEMTVEPIFHSRNIPVNDKMIFILMPFKEPWSRRVLRKIESVCKTVRMNAVRPDNLHSDQVVTENIWKGICEARIVIADITNRNPNVFYELGIAHTVGKKCILLIQGEEGADIIKLIPFDLINYQLIIYQDNTDGFKVLSRKLKESVNHILEHLP